MEPQQSNSNSNKSDSDKINQPLPKILNGTFFSVITINDRKVQARCMSCEETDKKSIVTGCIHPTSNFTTHLKKHHPTTYEEYNAYNKTVEVQAKKRKQSLLPFTRTTIASGAKIHTERAILDFVVQGMQALSVVETDYFRNLCKRLNPECIVMCKRTLRDRIHLEYIEKTEILVRRFASVKSICLTADIWSCRGRSFMGMTAHWLECSPSGEMERFSVGLSLRRFAGVHSNDRIAELLQEIMASFEIHQKTICIVTDNASNFVKAFKDFGKEFAQENGVVEEAEDLDDAIEDAMEPDGFPTMDVCTLGLPHHIRCASHTLSLIATKDLTKTTGSLKAINRKIMRGAMGKCSSVWNKISRSVQAAESVKALVGFTLPRPVVTRWNSTFDSITRLLQAKPHLDTICAITGTPKFSPPEISYSEDYIIAMQPVAWALDKLQAEKGFYFGFLGPTIIKTKIKLDAIKAVDPSSSGFAKYIADELHTGLTERFRDIISFNVESAKFEIIAAVATPIFKLRWIPEEKRDAIKIAFICEAEKFSKLDFPPHPLAESSSDWDEIFVDEAIVSNRPTQSVEIECLSYLQDPGSTLATLCKYPTVKEMFKYYNTPLASSAPVERLFSYAGMILRPKRANLTDNLFEELTFLKLYKE